MNCELKRAVLYVNIENDVGQETAKRVAAMLGANGWKTSLCLFPNQPDLTDAEILITFGGDGTILRAARAATEASVPILGINMGGKGFIAELEPDDIELIELLAKDGCKTETRMMIDVEVCRGNKIFKHDFALNDAVIKGDNKVIGMTIYADGQRITKFSGDGTIIATPTGSTAYSMSAGGPLVEPTAKNIIITPICAHILEAKSFVLTANREVTVEVDCKKDTFAYVSVDGGDHVSIQSGDTINVRKSERTTELVRLSDKSFYHRISSKLSSRG